jgi:hypothetical protein
MIPVLALSMTGSAAVAQAGRPWVDPPAPPAAAPANPPAEASPTEPPLPGLPATPLEAAPAPDARPPARSAQPPREVVPEPSAKPRETAAAAQERAARQLAIDYLDFWSAPNAVTLEATPDFYAPRVEFHGREMSARALFEEKRRFIQRWPVRAYAPRRDTMRVACSPSTGFCTVRTVFDFTAVSPERGRRSQGVGRLELEIRATGGRPVIVAETSRVVQRGGQAREVSLEEAQED